MEDDDTLSVQETHDLQVAIVQYMLTQSISKLPIKKLDIVTHCLRGKTKTFNLAFEAATKKLKKVYGMEVVRVKGIKTGQQFICYSSDKTLSVLARSPEECKTLPILYMVLAYTFMKGGALAEYSIWHFLEKLGFDLARPHDTFGDIKKLLDTFTKQLYLKKTKTTTEPNNEIKITIEWGQRADLEFTKSSILETVAEIMQKPANSFKKQFDDAKASEVPEAAADDV